MTGNQIKGKGFRGALRYNLDKVERGVAEVLDHSFVSLSEKTIMKEVQFMQMLRPNLQKYFYHTSINFPPSEELSNEMMTRIGRHYLELNGFTQHQYMMFRHYDANHPHLHILVNRIGYDGSVVSDSKDYLRSENSLRYLEVEYGLTRVTPSKEAKKRAMTKDELEMTKRTNELSQKSKLYVIVSSALKEKPRMTTAEFIQALESKGVNVLFNQASTGFVSGISYGHEGFIIKGAKLGNDFKWSVIKSVINYDQGRDRETIQAANVKAKTNNLRSEALTNSERNRATVANPSKDFNLDSLMKDFSKSNFAYVEDQPDPHFESQVSRKRKRKKRRGKRL